MTAHKARSIGKTPKGNNKKDGATGHGRRRSEDEDRQFESLGFKMADWNKWSYTWSGDFPIFLLVPGIVDFMPGWVAINQETKYQIPIGRANPAEIKRILDDAILEIMRHEAELIEAEIEYEYDADGNQWADIDLWMTRPEEARVQSMPATKQFAKKHGLSPEDAAEMMRERAS